MNDKNTASGDSLTVKELRDHLAASPENTIAFCVANNPADSYQFIQQNYPGEFRQYTRGFERNDKSQAEMLEFLNGKSKNWPDGPNAYAAAVFAMIPYNSEAQNWTTKII